MRAAVIAVLVAGCFSKPPYAGTADAGQAACVEAACAAADGTCREGVCHIETTRKEAVPRCPDDMPCQVDCLDEGCENGVDCGGATDCAVSCIGDNACKRGGVDCGVADTCEVTCRGGHACEMGPIYAVECRSSQCEVTCVGDMACGKGVNTDTGTCISHCCNGACDTATSCPRDGSCPG